MIDVHEAESLLFNNLGSFGSEVVTLESSYGRILKETWTADRDLPPYDRVTMDGIAIKFQDFQSGIRMFKIQGIAPAGMEKQSLRGKGNCLEIMTGSIMPEGADTVIRYEDLLIEDNLATIQVETIRSKQNVHFKGEDRKAGEQLISPNTLISSPEIGIGASIGKTEVKVARQPRVIVLSTGDELVPISKSPLPHQIRRSNVYRLLTTLKHFNISADQDHLQDEKHQISERLEIYLDEYDVILLSGGVSKGKFDFIPEVLEELGVRKMFHKIKQRPGKPFWFGNYNEKCSVFALPGNPVSSFLCMHRYFIPWLRKSLDHKAQKQIMAVLCEDVHFKPDLTYFLEVKLDYDLEGKILAQPVKGNGSGDLANIADADAFIELPKGRNTYKKGEVFPIHIYRL